MKERTLERILKSEKEKQHGGGSINVFSQMSVDTLGVLTVDRCAARVCPVTVHP